MSVLKLRPSYKDYIWGGHRLVEEYGKEYDGDILAESWELSCHPDGPSTLANGQYAGKTLEQYIEEAGKEVLGTNCRRFRDFPILIKFIDAKNDLSIQVHPDNRYALKNEGQYGKTEMWYVMDATKNARLIYGFYHDIDKETLRQSLEQGTVEKYLQKVPVKKDDVFYIEAGTVHAIGAGALIAEVQESSNLTYRMYDYNRVDKYGRHRELHIEKALEVANLHGSAEPRQPMRVLRYKKGCASELLCRCKYFQVERQLINTERYREMADIRTGSNSFQVLLCIGGCGVLFEENGESLNFFKGDCLFLPADSVPLKIHGRAQMLKVSC